MNKWLKNRIKELTEQRRDELIKYFDEHEWTGDLGEAEEERLLLYYSEEYIPFEIERLMYEDDWDEDFVKALQEISFKYYMPILKESWDKIETEYPEYFETIKTFFESFIQEYDKAFQRVHDRTLEEYVSYTLEQEAECIRERAEEEYSNLNE